MRGLCVVVALAGCVTEHRHERSYGLFEVRRVEYGFHAGPALVWPETFQLALADTGATPIGPNVLDATLIDWEPDWVLMDVRERWSSPAANIGLVEVTYELALIDETRLEGLARMLKHVDGTRVEVGFDVSATRVAPR
jgi:hypothetical protein